MRLRQWKAAAVLGVTLLAAVWLAGVPARDFTRRDARLLPSALHMAALPRTILWAWERPEDLSSIDPQRTGVAFLARTIFLSGQGATSRPRLQPLRVPPGAALVAVVRIESDAAFRVTPTASSDAPDHRSKNEIQPQTRDGGAKPSLNANGGVGPPLPAALAEQIAAVVNWPGVRAVQIDYDARESEHAFYAEALRELRARLPADVPISITALASWCIGDPWLSNLPIDEAVPMLFRMGPDRGEVLGRLRRGEDFREPLCRTSLGLSTDEPVGNLPVARRRYIFHPRSWDRSAAQIAAKEQP
jgi:hypothetical protein